MSAVKKIKLPTIKKPLKIFGFLRVFSKIGQYFKGSWTELREVRWPNRQTTWGLVLAVLAFSLFFIIFITLLDFGFKKLFELIIN